MKNIFFLALSLSMLSISIANAKIKVWPGSYYGSGNGTITCYTKGSLCYIVVTPNSVEPNIVGNTTTYLSNNNDIQIEVPDANIEVSCHYLSSTVYADVTVVNYE